MAIPLGRIKEPHPAINGHWDVDMTAKCALNQGNIYFKFGRTQAGDSLLDGGAIILRRRSSRGVGVTYVNCAPN